ncbi:hypothetical protein [Rhizobium sullae]|uniref:Uncharacterized protein n=1 Tax=Rhizobium sullae TaxID=50338 RepID=A0A4R3QIY6_RHISU|nr:hypothetical protein [Rhizobium sullae]TCU18196.1 hypothetical protein EV132_103316 [Rhizobium sullae]
MARKESLQPAPVEKGQVVDLGDATETTLGNNKAGVHEPLGPRRYRR